MMPRLAAEERLDAATAVALGTGSMKQGEAQRVVAALERQARPGGSRLPTAKADRRVLSMIGIELEEV